MGQMGQRPGRGAALVPDGGGSGGIFRRRSVGKDGTIRMMAHLRLRTMLVVTILSIAPVAMAQDLSPEVQVGHGIAVLGLLWFHPIGGCSTFAHTVSVFWSCAAQCRQGRRAACMERWAIALPGMHQLRGARHGRRHDQ